jgi:predicted nucleic acid-binding protein
MMEVFLDASVLFSAAYSQTGASRELIRLGVKGEIQLVISNLVCNEALTNLESKAPEVAHKLSSFFQAVPFKEVKPGKEEVLAAMKYTEFKDAPVVAAARCAEVDYLISLDKAHLVGVAAVQEGSGLNILLPGEFLEIFRKNQ